MSEKQRTISQPVSFSGKGLHTGKVTTATVLPSEPNTGIRFKRIDLDSKPIIPANPEYVVECWTPGQVTWPGAFWRIDVDADQAGYYM